VWPRQKGGVAVNDVNKNLNLNLRDQLKWNRNPKGEIGIEVEVEGKQLPIDPELIAANWEYHNDGSLRNGGAEYVIRNPVTRANLPAALEALAASLAKAKPVFTYRTSIHVHINVQHLTLRQWINYIVLYAIFEEALVDVVGPERAGNKFCLRFRDAEEPLNTLRQMLQVDRPRIRDWFGGENQKYAGMNLQATPKFGTCEFRSMRGNLDIKFINDWAQLLVHLRDLAERAHYPTDLVLDVSRLGVREFVRQTLPADNSITAAVLKLEGLEHKIMYGARLAQDVAYAVEWPLLDAKPEAEQESQAVAYANDLLRDFGMDLGDIQVAPAPRVRPRFRINNDGF